MTAAEVAGTSSSVLAFRIPQPAATMTAPGRISASTATVNGAIAADQLSIMCLIAPSFGQRIMVVDASVHSLRSR